LGETDCLYDLIEADVEVKGALRLTVSQSVRLGIELILGALDQI
jgi:hypothetical protein